MVIANLRDSSLFISVEFKEKAFDILFKLLKDSESFVYIAAVHALAHLVSREKPLFLHRVLSILTDNSPETTLRERVLLVETLVLTTRRTGPSAASFATLLVHACIKLIRFRPGAGEEKVLTDSNIDLLRHRSVNVELDAARSEKVEDGFYTADSVILRQSAVSLLAEITVAAGFTSFPFLFEVIDVAVGILSTESLYFQVTIYARRYVRNSRFLSHNYSSLLNSSRSAAFLLRYIIRGLKEKLISTSLGAENLRLAYRGLKIASHDADSVVRFHADAALFDLDEFMRSQLFISWN